MRAEERRLRRRNRIGLEPFAALSSADRAPATERGGAQLWTSTPNGAITLSITLYSGGVAPPPSHGADAVQRSEAYRTIGAALLEAELRYLEVGIPWIPELPQLSLRMPQPRRGGELSSLSEFLRVELSTVQTPFLEGYLEDLESLPLRPEGDPLHTAIKSWGERYGGAIIAALAAFACLTFICVLAGQAGFGLSKGGGGTVSASTLYSLAIFSTLFGGTLGYFSMEPQRRLSFYIALQAELSRRRGESGSSGMTKLPLTPFGLKE